MIVQPTEPNLDVAVLFSALPTAEAREMEPVFAAAGYKVLTNASPLPHGSLRSAVHPRG